MKAVYWRLAAVFFLLLHDGSIVAIKETITKKNR